MIHDADFFRRNIQDARHAVTVCNLDDVPREVVLAALDLLGATLANPETLWRPWHTY